MNKFENFSKWFDNLLLNAEVLDNRYPIKGFSVYKSWGARIIRKITEILENKLDLTEHDPMLFPVVISEDSFAKETEHIRGFTSEVFWITQAGKRNLKKKMLLRPTSETAMYPMFNSWIRSHADLPLKIYQTASVYRYETKATRPLLRMREFLWNEVHTVHKNWEDAERQIKEALGIYDSVFKQLGLDYYILKRPDFDKFAGALYSIAFDAWNPDGRVNQIGTIHNLGNKFAKAFDITYEDVDGIHKDVSQTCYGFGISRTLAAIMAQHGDDHGMILPPEIAPIQVVIIPIQYKKVECKIETYTKKVYEKIKKAGIRVHIDSEEKTPGEKFYFWEMLGIPIRVEIGPRDLKEGQVTISERVSLKRSVVSLERMVPEIKKLFNATLKTLSERSQSTLTKVTCNVYDLDSLKKTIENKKIAKVSWCENIKCSDIIKESSGGEIRGYKINIKEEPESPCIACGYKANKVVYISKAY
jgi:prolyl-tRNA synthetase